MGDGSRDKEVEELALTAGQLSRRRTDLERELGQVVDAEKRVLARLREICPHAQVVEHVHRTIGYDFRLGPKRVCKTCGFEEDGARGFKTLTAAPAERVADRWCTGFCCKLLPLVAS